MRGLIDRLAANKRLDADELLYLLDHMEDADQAYLREKAHAVRLEQFGTSVYMRGLIEFTNHCKRNCLYCGIRAGNQKADRYRLSEDEILNCCKTGHALGYRTFVLQGGEDDFYTDESILGIIDRIKGGYPDCALTLSLGEKPYASYKKYFEAGADRYLLRHETASENLYRTLHPGMSQKNRMECLYNLKTIGYQVGAGFLVGLPGQSSADYVQDLLFLKELQPHMVGIGPFIPHQDTPLAQERGGTLQDTVILLSMLRLLLPEVLLPATTALGSIDPFGREKGIQAGANVVMPNLSPTPVRAKYALYDGKICTGDEAAECRQCIAARIQKAGFAVDMSRGDHREWRHV